MDGNYEWQKHRANERLQARLQEAEAHRQAKQGNGRRTPFSLPLKIAVPALVGVLIAIWLLTGCTTTAEPTAPEPETAVVLAADSPGYGQRMVERIRFQDKREMYLAEDTAVKPQATQRPVWTMADRIRFQDRVEGTRP